MASIYFQCFLYATILLDLKSWPKAIPLLRITKVEHATNLEH